MAQHSFTIFPLLEEVKGLIVAVGFTPKKMVSQPKLVLGEHQLPSRPSAE